MSTYNIIASTDEATVVADYTPFYASRRPERYQSEAELEREFIELLQEQGYEYVRISNEEELIDNLRTQLQRLNNYKFTNNEWNAFFTKILANPNESIEEKTRKIQEDYIQNLTKDDGMTQNISLIDKRNIHNNRLQVINQYEAEGGKHKSRYDVTILVNGLPLVHVELKRRGIQIKEAFNQINRYQRDSFWASSGLFEYIQIFVISNGTNTKYYSNTTRNYHIKELSNSGWKQSKKTSHSFEFTSYWADAKNKSIRDLVDFTKTFFAKHTLLNILTKYCVFTSEQLLLVMRPYQIAATEKILSRIVISSNYKKTGTVEAGGYIWHTTGSGKTLTSFKTAQLATSLEGIDKVIFVVDRKDLDYQTMKEYDRFEKGAANGNNSTRVLQRQLENRNEKGGYHDYRIIVTTIQKLDVFIKNSRSHDIYKKHVVLIFDECHRSQFGEMHRRITKHFKKYHIFGFTGTPIFAENAPSGSEHLIRTTEQAFGEKLHTYTIVDAINDGNVLPFRIDYINTMRVKEDADDKKVQAIDREKALAAPERIEGIVAYVLDHFDQKTKRRDSYTFTAKWDEKDKLNPRQLVEKRETRILRGFNSIFATASIPVAMKYYAEFKKQLDKREDPLTIATIFSFAPNEEQIDGLLPDEDFNVNELDQSSRDFLESAIKDYNKLFSTNFDTSSEKFQNYYKDLSLRVKNREIDILIVINMFLTGFDATTLNTLWVDKNVRQHGLIQAFSRTNRILNSIKTFGNIVSFRDLRAETDAAIGLFGDKEAGGIVLLRTFIEYYEGYIDEKNQYKPGYKQLIEDLRENFPLHKGIIGESNQKDFIRLYGKILKLRNILTSFDEFEEKEILSPREFQDYQSTYIDLYDKYRNTHDPEREDINDDIVFEIELIQQVEVNIDYILLMVAKYKDSNCKDKEILVDIDKAISASIELRSKRKLIEQFIATVNINTNVISDWEVFLNEKKEEDLSTLIDTEKLREQETRRFVDNAFRDGVMKTTGTEVDKLLPPLSRFNKEANRAEKKQTIIEKLLMFFEKYFGLI